MQTFTYVASKNDTHEIIKADVEAESERAAAKLLMAQGMFPVSIDIKGEGNVLAKVGFGSRVRAKERVIFTRQLSTLINAGLPLTQSLRTIVDQIQSKALKQVVIRVVSDVE